MKKKFWAIGAFAIIIFVGIFGFLFLQSKNSQKNSYQILPSDNSVFTEGLFFDGENYVISGGNPQVFPQTKSFVGTISSEGKVQEKFIPESQSYFGEGITKLDGKIYFLTWKQQK